LNSLKDKYKFLSNSDLKLLYLIAKSKIEYGNIKDLKKNDLKSYIKSYVKYELKNNKKDKDANNVDVSDLNVNTLFLLKKLKLDNNKSYFYKINGFDINKVPNNDLINRNLKRNKKLSKMFSAFILIINFSVMFYCGLNINNWRDENKKTKNITASITSNVDINESVPKRNDVEVLDDDYFKYLNVSMLDVDFNELKKQNKDTKGWIKVNGTNVNYPFVQSGDNEYYLKHSFDNSYNKKGWVFLDYRNDIDNIGKNTILYAHGLMNNAMFGSLRKILTKSWYTNSDNKIIKIATENKLYLYEVFSTYKIEPESYYITTDFYSSDEFNKFVNDLKQRSVYDYNVGVSGDDKILTLSSCYDNTYRMVLHAKLIASKDR